MEPKFLILFFIFVTIVLTSPFAFCDVIELIDGGQKIVGKIIEESETHITVKLTTGGTTTFPKSWIKTIEKEEISESQLYTEQDLYFIKLNRIDLKDPNDHLKLAKWCLKNATKENGLSEMANRHFRRAIELDPEVINRAAKELLIAQDKEGERLYSIAETEFEAEEYIKAEKSTLVILFIYPESNYAKKARKLFVKIWGSDRAERLLNEEDELPEIVFSQMELNSVLIYFKTDELKEKYFMKCLHKAMDFENRAKEVSKKKRQGYYIGAISCYEVASRAEKFEIKNFALPKQQELIEKFFESTPTPDNDAKYSLMSNYLNKLEDTGLLDKISRNYFELGQKIYEKVKKSQQPERAEKAKTAYFCFSLAHNYSQDEQIKQEAFNKMVEAQHLERALD